MSKKKYPVPEWATEEWARNYAAMMYGTTPDRVSNIDIIGTGNGGADVLCNIKVDNPRKHCVLHDRKEPL